MSPVTDAQYRALSRVREGKVLVSLRTDEIVQWPDDVQLSVLKRVRHLTVRGRELRINGKPLGVAYLQLSIDGKHAMEGTC